MSSLRLALKQSLQDAGGGFSGDDNGDPKRRKKNRNKKRNQLVVGGGTKKQRRRIHQQDGDPAGGEKKKRGPGRPRKYPRADDVLEAADAPPKKRGPGRPRKHPRPEDDQDDEDEKEDNPEIESSDENEFSYDEATDDGSDEDDDSGDDDSSDEEADDHDEEEDRSTILSPDHLRQCSSRDHDMYSSRDDAGQTVNFKSPSETGATEEELRRQRRLMKKKLKHSAAHKIQSHWKKKRSDSISGEDGPSTARSMGASSDQTHAAEDGSVALAVPDKPSSARSNKNPETGHSEDEDDHVPVKKKKKRKKNTGVVPRPSSEIIEWGHKMSEKKCRKHISSGMRVKVRFAVPVKRDGQTIKKKIWYGGRVTAVSKMGSKIRIKYDDGTSEVSKFPDEDVVVDSEMNGEHAVLADRFIPPSLRQKDGKDGDDGHQLHRPSITSVDSGATASSKPIKQLERDFAPQEGPGEKPAPRDQSAPPFSEAPPASDAMVDQFGDEKCSVSIEVSTPVKRNDHTIGSENKETKTAPKLLGSPEEGELSPGITLKKVDVSVEAPPDLKASPEENSSNIAAKPESQASVGATETPILPQSKDTEQGTASSGSKPKLSKTSEDDPTISSPSKLKLAIRIPNIAKAQVQAPQTSDPPESSRQTLASDNLVDEALEDERSKRKRAFGKEDELEEPPKSRIKLSIAKPPLSSDETKEDNDGSGDVKMAVEETDFKSKPAAQPVDMSPTESSLQVTSASKMTAAADEQPKAVPIKIRLPQQKTQQLEAADGQEVVAVASSAPIVEKANKKERAKSPLPKSPVPRRAPSPESTAIPKEALVKTPISESDKAFSGTDKDKVSEPGEPNANAKAKHHPVLATHTSTDSFNSVVARGGRKAAQDAMEKMTSKDKGKEKDPSGGEKKKRKRKDCPEDTEDWVNEMEWVQCDSCSKWRVLPRNIKVSDLPNSWFCHMNVDLKRNSCDAPEQTAKQALKELKRAKKRARRLEQLAAEKGALQDLAEKNLDKQVSNTAVSPKPTKGTKAGAKSAGKSKDGTESNGHADSGEDDRKKGGKKGKAADQQPETVESQAEVSGPAVEPPKKKRRGRPPRNTSGASNDSRDADNVEWVQCEKCSKWRKLPADISADELADIWYCSLNTWNTAVASCKAPEETADAAHHEVGTSEWQLRQTHAGKYSYRTMIFGTGAKKQNRPMSERSRAAESLFQSPDNDERPYPTCMYSKSSMFLPRTSNFHKSQMVEEKSMSVFEVLSESNLFAELRAMDPSPAMVSSSGSGPKYMTYDILPEKVKSAMMDGVLQILGTDAFTGDQVIVEAQRFPWDAADDAGLGDLLKYCNTDVIINTLLTLVRDGLVEMASLRDPSAPMAEWIPKYRRTETRRANELVETVRSSSCLKIAKPWKRKQQVQSQQNEWVTVTGGAALYS